MVMARLFATSLFALLVPVTTALRRYPVPISEIRKQIRTGDEASISTRDFLDVSSYPACNFSVPIDHFHNDSMYEPHSNGTYNMRYWFDSQYYKEGGPVILLAAGETSGVGRLPFLQKGIVYQLAKATNGLGVILEHRYYGESWPVDDLSTASMRFLTTDQALADTAYFAKNIKFPGLEHLDLTAGKTAYIAYGGSYAGAFVAFLRKLYPDVFWGAISSSGVTQAIYDYWEYFTAAAVYGPPACVETTRKLTNIVDNILFKNTTSTNATDYITQLKSVFGLSDVRDNADFASVLANGIYGLQSYNWDPANSGYSFFEYCGNVSSDDVLYPSTESFRSQAEELIVAGGWGAELSKLSNRMLNYIGFVRGDSVASCEGDQESCFGTKNATFYQQSDMQQEWRSWPYQYCTQWGYLQTGSGVPANQLPLISRTIDIPYTSQICRDAFNITEPSNVTAINKYGGFGLSYPRLAIVDGEWDPWRAATPHALGQPNRPNTISRPFILIDKAVHHWDENGLFPNETTPELPPSAVADAQQALTHAVRQWMDDWKTEKGLQTELK